MLQDTVARLVRDSYGFEQRERFYHSETGFSPDFWRQLGELGICAVPLAEEQGGLGGGGVDTLLVMTELGRNLCLEPYLHSQVYGAGLLQQLGSDAQRAELLPRVAAGELQLAVALEESQSHYQLHDVQTRAEPCVGGWRLTGRKCVVVGGDSAGLILVSARTSGAALDEAGISLFLVDPNLPGITLRSYPCIDGPRACELHLNGVVVGEDGLLGAAGKALPALRYQQGRAIAA
ncbi:Acyl-CoA dehydrogenase fadE12 [compost metagenome]